MPTDQDGMLLVEGKIVLSMLREELVVYPDLCEEGMCECAFVQKHYWRTDSVAQWVESLPNMYKSWVPSLAPY